MAKEPRDIVITQRRSSWAKVLDQWPDIGVNVLRRRLEIAVTTTGAYEDPMIAIAWTQSELSRLSIGGIIL